MANIRIILPQNEKTKISSTEFGCFHTRYMYNRARGSIEAQQNGQDILGLACEGGALVFAVCDGVGRSFFGDLGAQRLGTVVLDWLSKSVSEYDDPSSNSQPLVEKLSQRLAEAAKEVQQEVEAVDISWIEIPDLIRILEKRRTAGTQSTLACGILLPESSTHPHGFFCLYWLGNTRINLYKDGEDVSHLMSAIWDDKFRWSSKIGVIGDIQQFQGDFQSADSLIIHSDGFDRAYLGNTTFLKKLTPEMPSEILNQTMDWLETIPESDDISYLEIAISNNLYADIGNNCSREKKSSLQESCNNQSKILERTDRRIWEWIKNAIHKMSEFILEDGIEHNQQDQSGDT